ncbi:hypothetical protein AFV8_gp02 [Betalipothrixvirus puteoliense]|uniref:Uncharacterized protein n=1 Tax=Betalipothrixvirus puteoliense TaxID=346884 RepID=A7WKT2_9VIRU|nr:hypothetical protein AFV8_gp02 [Acidianus filamentous virus 8]CAJ31679.1 conserved hypothetical protein [Acidianus filamentous virus 8]
MGELEEKFVRVIQLLSEKKTVKMRKAQSVEPVKDVELLHGIVVVEFQDGELLLLTREQFLNREIIVEEKEKIEDVEKRVEEMLKAINELRKRGYSIYYKGKKVEEIRKEGHLMIIRTTDGTIYTQKEKEFLNAYKTAKVI